MKLEKSIGSNKLSVLKTIATTGFFLFSLIQTTGCDTKTLPTEESQLDTYVAPYGTIVDMKNKVIILPHGSRVYKEAPNNTLQEISPLEIDFRENFIIAFNKADETALVFNFNLPTEKSNSFEYPPKMPYLDVVFWNNTTKRIVFPDDVWKDAFDACIWVNNGVYDPTVCNPALLLAIAITENDLENPIPYNPQSGACGLYQFMPGTWQIYTPNSSNWSCLDKRESAFVAARMTVALGLHNQPDKKSLVERFTGSDGGLVWNRHKGQAEMVWEVKNAIDSYLASFPLSQGKILREPNLVFDSLLGIPYKPFGYKDNNGLWITYKEDQIFYDHIPGLNCGGFVLELARSVSRQPLLLENIIKRRNDRPISNTDCFGCAWNWYGYDEIMNISDALNGRVFIPADIPSQRWGIGVDYSYWSFIPNYIKKGHLYLGSINRPIGVDGERQHFHVFAVRKEGEETWVYEAVSSASRKILWDYFIKQYSEGLNLWMVEIPLN